MIIVAVALFCLTMATWAARRRQLLIIANVTAMVYIPLLGGTTLQIFGYTSTFGNIFFCTVIYGLTLKYKVHGVAATRDAIRNILFAQTMVLGLILLLNQYKTDSIFTLPSRIMAASFISFWFVQPLLIYALGKWTKSCPLLSTLAVTVATHLTATSIFFPAAFIGVVSNAQVLQFTIVGMFIKTGFVVLSAPFLVYTLCDTRRRPVQF